jgi:diaminohydroxyphosphoribosylaminopyrimidine deaminase / 5-amino-6-(5-phosphoribosylamino)uracil reductase
MITSTRDEVYILRCLELARKGLGTTRQNPLVGSVIVYNNKIIGEGYHTHFGGPHAEVRAINSVKDKMLLSRSTLYVNLEPCSHFGKTPPCTSLIRDSKIPKVVIGSPDSNPEISGSGIRILQEIGIEVITGVKEEECRFLNRRFFTFHEKKRPYIILKWAQSKDGFIDIKRDSQNKRFPTWISNHTARILVHKWRSEEIAIMAGTNTILSDDPRLNVREWPGENPLRIVLDRNGRLFDNLRVFNGESKTLVFTYLNKTDRKNVSFIRIPENNVSFVTILKELRKLQVLSILVEGGANLLNHFLESGLWDEARVFTGNNYFLNGVPAPVIATKVNEQIIYRGNLLNFYVNK